MTRVLLVVFGLATLAAAVAGYTDGPVLALGLLTVAAAVVYAAELVAGRLALWTDDDVPAASPHRTVPLDAELREWLLRYSREVYADGWSAESVDVALAELLPIVR